MKKIILYLILLIIVYKGLDIYATFGNAKIALDCGDLDEVARIQKFGSKDQKLAYSNKYWSCIKNKQNFIQKFFFKVPDSFLSSN